MTPFEFLIGKWGIFYNDRLEVFETYTMERVIFSETSLLIQHLKFYHSNRSVRVTLGYNSVQRRILSPSVSKVMSSPLPYTDIFVSNLIISVFGFL